MPSKVTQEEIFRFNVGHRWAVQLGTGIERGGWNEPSSKVLLYKRFEFPSGLNYVPEGSEEVQDALKSKIKIITSYDINRPRIANPVSTPKKLKLVVVVHGWNKELDVGPYNEGS